MLKSKRVVNSEYHFVRCLGEGLSSVVFEATRSNASGIANERVAVKVLKSENSVLWLQNEFECLSKVNSPHCVRVLGHEDFDEGPALVLEFINGVTLFALASRFKLTEAEISYIETQVISGLRAISETGCAHGDLNPKNILLTTEGVVKLIDFGAFVDAKEIFGAAPYVSSKILAGERPNFESDLESWSLIRRELNIERDSQMDSPALSLTAKVLKLSQEKSLGQQTAVLKTNSRNHKTRMLELVILAAMVVLMLFPAQTLLSEPLKAADPSSISVRTSQWTEITINHVSKGYAPLNLTNLPSGMYHIQYKRPHGSGELTFFLNPGQKRVLRDSDFRD